MKKIIKDEKGRVRKVVTENTEPSLTQQQFKDMTDVNKIMEKYKKRPDPSIFVRSGQGSYGDFSQVKDYHSAMNSIIAANEKFAALPAHIRERFSHDPSKLIEFLDSPSNVDEAIKLGLMIQKETPEQIDEKIKKQKPVETPAPNEKQP